MDEQILINVQQNVKTKFDELKARMDETDKTIESIMFEILQQNKRGRFLIWILGLKDKIGRNEVTKAKLKRMRKLEKELNKLRG